MYEWILRNRKTRNILYAFNAAASSCHRVSFSQLFRKSVQSPQFPTVFQNSLICFCSKTFKTYKFSIKIWSSMLKLVFTPKHWHQTVVCYQEMCVRYPIIYHVKLMTRMIHRLKKTTSMTVKSLQKNYLKCDIRICTFWKWEKNWCHFTM